MVKVYAPASSANMSVGFDVLGAAVTPVDGTLLGDNVSVEAADSFSLQNVGRFASKLPSAPQKHYLPVLGAFLSGNRQKSSGVDGTGKKHADWLRSWLQRLFCRRRAGGDE